MRLSDEGNISAVPTPFEAISGSTLAASFEIFKFTHCCTVPNSKLSQRLVILSRASWQRCKVGKWAIVVEVQGFFLGGMYVLYVSFFERPFSAVTVSFPFSAALFSAHTYIAYSLYAQLMRFQFMHFYLAYAPST